MNLKLVSVGSTKSTIRQGQVSPGMGLENNDFKQMRERENMITWGWGGFGEFHTEA